MLGIHTYPADNPAISWELHGRKIRRQKGQLLTADNNGWIAGSFETLLHGCCIVQSIIIADLNPEESVCIYNRCREILFQ